MQLEYFEVTGVFSVREREKGRRLRAWDNLLSNRRCVLSMTDRQADRRVESRAEQDRAGEGRRLESDQPLVPFRHDMQTR